MNCGITYGGGACSARYTSSPFSFASSSFTLIFFDFLDTWGGETSPSLLERSFTPCPGLDASATECSVKRRLPQTMGQVWTGEGRASFWEASTCQHGTCTHRANQLVWREGFILQNQGQCWRDELVFRVWGNAGRLTSLTVVKYRL